MRRLAVALVHYPVVGRDGELLTTTITNLDLHDLSRCVRSYGLEALFVVHPLESQRMLAERLTRHWVEGAGRKRIPDRGEALEKLRIVPDIATAEQILGDDCELWSTAAAARGSGITSYPEARALAQSDGPPVLLLFGTGWGLADELVLRAARRLEPICAAVDSGYNHLSVRAACAITLDRLLGPSMA